MRDLRSFQQEFGGLFQRKKQPPVADDFTAAVAICLDRFLKSRGYVGCVSSEETTHRQRGATRPDISVRNSKSELLATIECKTNLGWNRNGWKLDHETRSADLRKLFPACSAYFCVMSQNNWDSTELQASPLFGREWFCLCNTLVATLPHEVPDSSILTPIEPMFIEVLRKLELWGD
jgi:hypothetical protein